MRVLGICEVIILMIPDWLTDRMAYCEVGGKSSMLRVIEEGTVQESILGPILFAIFVSPLRDIIEATSYANDNFIIRVINVITLKTVYRSAKSQLK
jgi:hypothetical protein